MIKLDKKDVKVVAASRFWRKYLWWWLGGLVLLFAAMIVLLALTKIIWFGLIPIALYIAGLIWIRRKLRKAERALISEWNASSGKE